MSRNMPPLWLDFQRPPPGRSLPGIILLLASLLLAGLLLGLALDVASETASAEQQLGRLRQVAERQRLFAGFAPSTAATTPAASPPDGRWEALFGALETAGNETVTLLSLNPGNREIVITGEAVGLEAALDYARRLQAAPALSHAHLVKYEVVREHPRQPVLFTLLAEWSEAAQ